MTNKLFINIYIDPKPNISVEEVEKKLNLSIDWFRYNDNTYIVYTSSSVDKWMIRLKPLAEKGGRLFICELNLKNRNGWMAKDFWEWVRKKRAI